MGSEEKGTQAMTVESGDVASEEIAHSTGAHEIESTLGKLVDRSNLQDIGIRAIAAAVDELTKHFFKQERPVGPVATALAQSPE